MPAVARSNFPISELLRGRTVTIDVNEAALIQDCVYQIYTIISLKGRGSDSNKDDQPSVRVIPLLDPAQRISDAFDESTLVILDASQCPGATSSLLWGLIQHSNQVIVACPSEQFLAALEFAGIDDILAVTPTLEAAHYLSHVMRENTTDTSG